MFAFTSSFIFYPSYMYANAMLYCRLLCISVYTVQSFFRQNQSVQVIRATDRTALKHILSSTISFLFEYLSTFQTYSDCVRLAILNDCQTFLTIVKSNFHHCSAQSSTEPLQNKLTTSFSIARCTMYIIEKKRLLPFLMHAGERWFPILAWESLSFWKPNAPDDKKQ